MTLRVLESCLASSVVGCRAIPWREVRLSVSADPPWHTPAAQRGGKGWFSLRFTPALTSPLNGGPRKGNRPPEWS